ncbi:MAG: GntR family transcriptional regulator [Tuberibacillus sp.]
MINHLSLSDNVARTLREMILNGRLMPGERINQVHLAQELNISRGPLREALRLLQNEGLVKHETNKGTFVTSLSKRDIWEIYTLRALLEGKASQLALEHLTEKDFEKLDQTLVGFKKALKEHNHEAIVQNDITFHQIIVNASKHSLIIKSHQNLDVKVGAMYLTMQTQRPVRIKQVVDTHRSLVDALKSKDKERIKKEFSNHYLDALNDLLGKPHND